MARRARDSRLETREARSNLKPAHEPYWRLITPGLFLGYRKGATGGVWIARKLVDGKYRKETLGKADDLLDSGSGDVMNFKEAHDLAVKFGSHSLAASDQRIKTVADAVAFYLDGKCHLKSLENIRSRLGKHVLGSTLGTVKLTHLRESHVREWHKAISKRPAEARPGKNKVNVRKSDERQRKVTANRELSYLKAVLNYVHARNKIATDEAWRNIEPFANVESAIIRFYTHDEVERLLNACAPDFRDLVHGALMTGARFGDLVIMRVGHYNPQNQSVFIERPKNDRPRHVPLSAEGAALFQRLCLGKAGGDLIFQRADGQPWGRSHQTRPMHDACEAAHIDGPARFHLLRHTFASALVTRGVPLQFVCDLLGHHSITVTQRFYAHLAPSALADAVRQHLPGFGSGVRDNVKVLSRKN